METEIFLDTHVILWLFSGQIEKLSKKVYEAITAANLLASPMAILEIDFLYESKKIKVRGDVVIEHLAQEIDLQVALDPFLSVVKEAASLSWTRDPFDRLLVAHARLRDLPLVSKDRLLRKHYIKCLW